MSNRSTTKTKKPTQRKPVNVRDIHPTTLTGLNLIGQARHDVLLGLYRTLDKKVDELLILMRTTAWEAMNGAGELEEAAPKEAEARRKMEEVTELQEGDGFEATAEQRNELAAMLGVTTICRGNHGSVEWLPSNEVQIACLGGARKAKNEIPFPEFRRRLLGTIEARAKKAKEEEAKKPLAPWMLVEAFGKKWRVPGVEHSTSDHRYRLWPEEGRKELMDSTLVDRSKITIID